MSHRYVHFLEKLQVELAAILAVVGVYFLVAPALRGADPEFPVTFVAEGGYGRLAIFAGASWVAAAVCALLTVSARPEGAIVAALMGTAGASLYSPPIRALLWYRQDHLSGVFTGFRLEVLLLLVVLLGVMVVVALVRGAVGRVRPNWLWKSPIERLRDADADGKKPGEGQAQPPQRLGVLAETLHSLGILVRGYGAKASSRRSLLANALSFFGLGLLIGVVCLLLLLRSAQRGQILFALVTSFVVAVLVAHQVFPAAYSVLAWTMPIVAALILYTLAAASVVQDHPQPWMVLDAHYRALPIDWLTAGCGGAVLGYWISERLHEARHIENHQSATKGG